MEVPVIPFNPDLPGSSIRVFMEPPAANGLVMNQTYERPTSRVVMVSGIPALVSNEKMKELFDHCGPITDLWKNHSNICFLEFEDEAAACNAVIMSGFKIVIESGVRFTSQIMVNYALETEAKRPVIPFSKEACSLVYQKLSNESTFSEGTEILTKWLKNGECNRDNADDFFSLLQIASADKKSEEVKKINDVETELNAAVSDIADYLSVVDQVFNHENFNSILVNFSNEERQNLLKWKKEFEEAKVEINNTEKKARNKKNKRSAKKKATTDTISRNELLKLKQEKEDLELQLDVANLALVNDRLEQQREINALKQSVLEAQRQCAQYEAQLADWRAIHSKLKKAEEVTDNLKEDGLSPTEAKILTELSTYLGERLGATLSDIRNHLRRKDFHCTPKSIAQLMRRFPSLFREETVGSGPTMKVKWVFIQVQQ